MKNLTLFSWGYWGWGNSTRQLVELVDAIEEKRGFLPPIFVDIRIRRQVRATGFSGNAFGELLGPRRYRWMKWLGNQNIEDDKLGTKIYHPEGVESLLDLALIAAREKRRLVFFCGCPWAMSNGKPKCHRRKVGSLVLEAAAARGIAAEVVEWPGGKVRELKIEVPASTLRRITSGCRNIPMPKGVNPVELEGPAWASLVTFHSGSKQVQRLVGHVLRSKGNWQLQVVGSQDNEETSLTARRRESATLRETEGWTSRKAT